MVEIQFTMQALVLMLLMATATARLPIHQKEQRAQDLVRKLQTVTAWNQIGQDINGEAAADQSGWSVSMNEDGSRVAVAAPQNDGGGVNAGSVRVFEFGTSSWTLLGSAIQGVAGAGLGQSVSLSGDGRTLAVGSVQLPPYKGNLRIYRYENSAWRFLSQVDGINDRDQFGQSVSISFEGNRVAVGAPRHNDNGWTEVYEEGTSDTQWNLIGEIRGSAADEHSGHSVALSGDGTTVAIGAVRADPEILVDGKTVRFLDAGIVRVFRRSSSQIGWAQLGTNIPGATAGDNSGYSVSISSDGNTVAIGSPSHSQGVTNSGMARVFFYDGAKWAQLGANLFPETPAVSSKFGNSVSLSSSGLILAVGEPSDPAKGYAGIYYYSSNFNSWSRDVTLSAGAATDRYGYAVALSGQGTRVAVGAYSADQAGVDSGKTRVYEFQTSDWNLSVESFSANFETGTAPEFTLTYQGISPEAAAGRTYRMTVLLASCALGTASSNAIAPVEPTGSVPNAESFSIITRLDVDTDTIQSSGFFASGGGVGEGNLAFCVQMEILEGTEVRVERYADITVDLNMGQDFLVNPLIQRTGTTDTIDIRESTQFAYGFRYYFCDELGNDIQATGGGQSVPPGGEVSVCLVADANEPVLVDNVKSVSFSNFMAPLLGVPLIDELGNPLDGTTTKDCSGVGVCRIAAITVPRLYEYVDSSGNTVDVTAGVSLEGIVTFAFPNRRLQDASLGAETFFRVQLDLANPPDRNVVREEASAAYRSVMWIATLGSLALFFLHH